jgi:hypothetical protein
LLASGTLREIRALLDNHPLKIRIGTARARELAAQLIQLPVVQSVELERPDQFLVEVLRPKEFFEPLAELITAQGHDLQRLQVIDATTEAVFDYLMQAAHYHY